MKRFGVVHTSVSPVMKRFGVVHTSVSPVTHISLTCNEEVWCCTKHTSVSPVMKRFGVVPNTHQSHL